MLNWPKPAAWKLCLCLWDEFILLFFSVLRCYMVCVFKGVCSVCVCVCVLLMDI